MNRLRRPASGLLAVLLALAAVLLSNGVAAAQTAAGTLTLNDASTSKPVVDGKDITILTGAIRCDASDGADSINAVVSGPGIFTPDASKGRADGLGILATQTLDYSTKDPIPFTLRGSMKDFAGDLGGSIVPGDYVITARCVAGLDGTVFQKYSATLRFSSATAFTVVGGATPAPGASPTPTPAASATPAPSPTASPGATPSPSASPSASSTADPTSTSAAATSTSADPAATAATSTAATAGAGTTGGGSTGGGKLAYTGAPVTSIVMLGIVLLAIGGWLFHAGRRRGLRG